MLHGPLNVKENNLTFWSKINSFINSYPANVENIVSS
jgi:hypothetical protein